MSRVLLNERILKIDDPCGAISVHGYWRLARCGLARHLRRRHVWRGVERRSARRAISASPGRGVTGLLYGDTSQFLCQLLGSTVCVAWAFGATFVVFKIRQRAKSMRVAKDVELEGLDVPEFGMPAYPEDVVVAEA